MKATLILLLASSLLASCTWTKADFKRLGTKVLDTTLSTAALEAQTIQVEKQK